MSSSEIRAKDKEYGENLKACGDPKSGAFLLQAATLEMTVEIAAQLADLNETLRKKAGE